MSHPPAALHAAFAAERTTAPDDDGFAIEAQDLVKTFPSGRRREPVRALSGLTLRVRPGEVFGLLGPNGAGKSTTVRILATLSQPNSGSVRVAGIDALADPAAVRRSIGLVSQKPSAAPMMTGRESLEMAARIHGLDRREARRRTDELLDRFGLGDAADRLTKTYSGGMNRKLDVAIGLVNRPSVLFLDEPTTGLDPEARAQMWAEIARMAAGHEQDGDTDHRPAHDALPRRGGPPVRPARHRRPRRSRRGGNPGAAQEPASRRQRRRSSSRTPRRPASPQLASPRTQTCARSPVRAGPSGPGPTMVLRWSRRPSRRWNRPESWSRPRPLPVRPSTTSTCGMRGERSRRWPR